MLGFVLFFLPHSEGIKYLESKCTDPKLFGIRRQSNFKQQANEGGGSGGGREKKVFFLHYNLVPHPSPGVTFSGISNQN